MEAAMMVFLGLVIFVGIPALMILATVCCVGITIGIWHEDLEERREKKIETLPVVRLIEGRHEPIGRVWVNPISWTGMGIGVLTLMIGFLSFGLSWMMLPYAPAMVGL